MKLEKMMTLTEDNGKQYLQLIFKTDDDKEIIIHKIDIDSMVIDEIEEKVAQSKYIFFAPDKDYKLTFNLLANNNGAIYTIKDYSALKNEFNKLYKRRLDMLNNNLDTYKIEHDMSKLIKEINVHYYDKSDYYAMTINKCEFSDDCIIVTSSNNYYEVKHSVSQYGELSKYVRTILIETGEEI